MKSLFLTVLIYFLQLRTVHGLLFAMGNTQHADSQRQAGIALEVAIMPSPRKAIFSLYFPLYACCTQTCQREKYPRRSKSRAGLPTFARDFEKVQTQLCDIIIIITWQYYLCYKAYRRHVQELAIGVHKALFYSIVF